MGLVVPFKKEVTINGTWELKYRTKYGSHFYEIFPATEISVGNGNYFVASSVKIFQNQ